eukprot:593763-Pyramimonas_sp.AAC.2
MSTPLIDILVCDITRHVYVMYHHDVHAQTHIGINFRFIPEICYNMTFDHRIQWAIDHPYLCGYNAFIHALLRHLDHPDYN